MAAEAPVDRPCVVVTVRPRRAPARVMVHLVGCDRLGAAGAARRVTAVAARRALTAPSPAAPCPVCETRLATTVGLR